MTKEKLIDVDEAADLFHLSVSAARRKLHKAGVYPKEKVGNTKKLLYSAKEVEKLAMSTSVSSNREAKRIQELKNPSADRVIKPKEAIKSKKGLKEDVLDSIVTKARREIQEGLKKAKQSYIDVDKRFLDSISKDSLESDKKISAKLDKNEILKLLATLIDISDAVSISVSEVK
jgi:hypothetical protein